MKLGNDDFVPVILGTGVGAYNIARSLHEAYQVRSLVLGRAALHETAKSSIIEVRASRDFDAPEAIVATLLGIADEHRDRQLLLIPTIEYYTNVVIDHRDVLEERYIVPLVDRQLADKLIDKTAFYRTCEEFGIPHPRTTVVTSSQQGDQSIGEDLPFSYPVIAKPSNTDIYQRLSFAGKQKIYRVDNAAQLRDVVERVFGGGYDDDMIVQEFIPGDETVMRVANTYSDVQGKMRLASVGQIVMADQHPDRVGNYDAILTIDDPQLTESMRSLLDAVGYTGTANFDVMRDHRDDTSKVLELNLRQGAACYYTMAAGGNIARALVEDRVYGRDPGDQVTTVEALWINLPRLVSRLFIPRPLRKRVRAAARRRTAHTLWYRPDMGVSRLLMVLRIDLRHTLSTFKYSRS
ncbi:carboxylate--amine ligase [Demequina aurantiaca]|uniref:carboxylate--amine ligase n=1 Tax=Demequina aurantiaca TaxID=676200 RepID=UPI0007819B8B|nr:hypothetical protein [Demequina aurantiaca]